MFAHYHRLGRAIDRFVLGRYLQNRHFCRDLAFREPEAVDQPGASFLLLSRRFVDRLGMPFDERYPLLFNDVDLARRVREAGGCTHVVPEVEVVHLGGVSSAELGEAAYHELHFRGLFTYFRQYHPLQYPLVCLAWPIRWLRFSNRSKKASGKATGS